VIRIVLEQVRPKPTKLDRVLSLIGAGLMVASILWPRPRRLL
jgi:hypothetical protein